MKARLERMLKTSEEPVAVVAPVNYNGINFTRALKAEGVPVVGIFGESSQWYYHTNSCEKVFCEDVNGDALIHSLEEIGRAARRKPALIPIGDLQVIMFSQHRELLDEYFLLNIPSGKTISILIDKTDFYRWGQDRYPFPKTFGIESSQDLEAALGSIRFPVVFKPRYRSAGWLRKNLPKASLFHDDQALMAFYRAVSESESVFLISEFVAGPDDNLWNTHFYYADGQPLGYYTDRKLRQWPHLLGTGAYCVSMRNDEIIHLTKAMLSELDYSGMGAMEFKREDRTGQYMIMEPCCGRPSHHFYIGRGEGVNLPFLVYCHLTGKPLPKYEQSGKVFGFLDEERDLRSAAGYLWQRRLSLRQYVRDLWRVRLCVNWSPRDPLVGFFFFLRLMRTLVFGAVRKTMRALTPRRRSFVNESPMATAREKRLE
jgi:D-aspartate ligase